MRILLAAMGCAKGDPAANLAAHEDVLDQAARSGCRIAEDGIAHITQVYADGGTVNGV